MILIGSLVAELQSSAEMWWLGWGGLIVLHSVLLLLLLLGGRLCMLMVFDGRQ
jgi:hypothetical protein